MRKLFLVLGLASLIGSTVPTGLVSANELSNLQVSSNLKTWSNGDTVYKETVRRPHSYADKYNEFTATFPVTVSGYYTLGVSNLKSSDGSPVALHMTLSKTVDGSLRELTYSDGSALLYDDTDFWLGSSDYYSDELSVNYTHTRCFYLEAGSTLSVSASRGLYMNDEPADETLTFDVELVLDSIDTYGFYEPSTPSQRPSEPSVTSPSVPTPTQRPSEPQRPSVSTPTQRPSAPVIDTPDYNTGDDYDSENVELYLNYNAKTIKKGKKLYLELVNIDKYNESDPEYGDYDAEDDVVWRSSNSKVASVNQSGVVKAKKKGTCKITATFGDRKFICKIKVK